MSKVIKAREVKDLITEQCYFDKDEVLWHFNDQVYRLPPNSMIHALVSSFEPQTYVQEIGDCDNRAFLLAAKFVEAGFCIGLIDVKQTFLGENHSQYLHQICITIDDTNEVWVIEPETKKIFKTNELLEIRFVDIRT